MKKIVLSFAFWALILVGGRLDVAHAQTTPLPMPILYSGTIYEANAHDFYIDIPGFYHGRCSGGKVTRFFEKINSGDFATLCVEMALRRAFEAQYVESKNSKIHHFLSIDGSRDFVLYVDPKSKSKEGVEPLYIFSIEHQ